MPKSLAQRFHDRFEGLDRAHGVYNVTAKTLPEGEKKLGSVKTVREAPEVEHWEMHLDGEMGLGIVPVKDDQTVRWGALDIDIYEGLDLVALSKKVMAADLPLMVCRTKSGGAHLFLFCREPISAETVRTRLMEWAIFLGYSGVETFPKQTRLAGEGDVGNWLNMPYQGARTKQGTSRYCIWDGKELSASQFLKIADQIAVDVQTLVDRDPPRDPKHETLLEEAPPCLQTLAQRGGVPKGTRNNGLFAFGIYLRKRYGDGDWEQHLDRYNQEFVSPPLGHKEVAQLVKAVNKKAYEYRCGDQPLCDVCNRQICLTRKWGVSTGAGDPGIVLGQLVKLTTDPPTWIWDVDGARIALQTQELKDQGRFHVRVIDDLNKWPLRVKPQEWAALVRDALKTVEIMEAPADASVPGQILYFLEEYCTRGRGSRAGDREGLLQNKPWTDPDEDRTYFRGPHFHQYLRKQGIQINARSLWVQLREYGADNKFIKLKGKGLNVWSVPAFDEQTEDFDVPVIDNEEEM